MNRWFSGNREPSLAEVLDDPIVHLVMERDRVRREDLIALIVSVRSGLPSSSIPGGPPRQSDSAADSGSPAPIPR